MPDLTTIADVEVFRTGSWRGRVYTAADLDEMVANFASLSGGRDFPVYVVDHPDNPYAVPAGIIARLYRRGERLLADLARVPEQIVELWRGHRFRGVSAGIRYNFSGFEECGTLRILLDNVALLTRTPPAIPGLNLQLAERFAAETADVVCYDADADLVAPADQTGAPDNDPSDQTAAVRRSPDRALSPDPSDPTDPSDHGRRSSDHPGPDTRAATPEQETTHMPTVEDLTAQLAAKEALLAAATQAQENFAARDTERAALQEKLAAAEEREAERVAADIRRETATTLEQFAAAGKLLPAQRDVAEYLLLHAPGDSVEQFAAADGATRTYAQTLVAFLDALPNLVEFSARTKSDPADKSTATLTDVQRAVAQRLGISEDRYAQQLAAA